MSARLVWSLDFNPDGSAVVMVVGEDGNPRPVRDDDFDKSASTPSGRMIALKYGDALPHLEATHGATFARTFRTPEGDDE